jgi:hypothetical protein
VCTRHSLLDEAEDAAADDDDDDAAADADALDKG